MNIKKTFLISATMGIAALNTNAHEMKAPEGKEKCYGIVKAGKNDCGSKIGAHGCAGFAKKDASPFEFILLPKGICERIAASSLEEKEKK
jgi:uncharacterized membrane protein